MNIKGYDYNANVSLINIFNVSIHVYHLITTSSIILQSLQDQQQEFPPKPYSISNSASAAEVSKKVPLYKSFEIE